MIYVNDIPVEFQKFPNGESRIISNLNIFRSGEDPILNYYGNRVTFKYEDDSDITKLIMVSEQVLRIKAPSELLIAHMPYARMDRVVNGDPMFLRTTANIINSLGYNTITLLEPHSDVATALLDNPVVIDVTKSLFYRTVSSLFKFNQESDFLVFPDTTADRRYWDIDKKIENRIVFNKHRDFETGKIVELSTDFNGYFKEEDDRTAVILDDMSSYGGTFIGVAKKLRSFGFNNIILIVAHAENSIFSGDLFKTDLIDKVITTDSMLTRHRDPHNLLVTDSDRMHIYNINEIIRKSF